MTGVAVAHSGLELMRRLRDGRLAPPPVTRALGLIVTHADWGRSRAVLPTSPMLCWPGDAMAAPALALVADVAIAAACQTVLAAGEMTATAQLAIRLHEGVASAGDALVAEGVAGEQLLSSAMRGAATIRDSRGAVVAECSALMATRAVTVAPLGVVHPVPSLQRLLGIRSDTARPGVSTWRMPAAPVLSNLIPDELFGGATAMLAGIAALDAARADGQSSQVPPLRQLTVRLRRTVRTDGNDLRARGVVVRRDGEEVITRAQVVDRRGEVVATAVAAVAA